MRDGKENAVQEPLREGKLYLEEQNEISTEEIKKYNQAINAVYMLALNVLLQDIPKFPELN